MSIEVYTDTTSEARRWINNVRLPQMCITPSQNLAFICNPLAFILIETIALCSCCYIDVCNYNHKEYLLEDGRNDSKYKFFLLCFAYDWIILKSSIAKGPSINYGTMISGKNRPHISLSWNSHCFTKICHPPLWRHVFQVSLFNPLICLHHGSSFVYVVLNCILLHFSLCARAYSLFPLILGPSYFGPL